MDDLPIGDGEGEVKFGELMSLAQTAGSLEDMAKRAGGGDSPAQIFQDIVNVHRLDLRILGRYLGVDLDAPRLSEDQAAKLLASPVEGDPVELVRVFNRLAEQRAAILREVMGEDDYKTFEQVKHDHMATSDPGGFGDDGGGEDGE